MKKFIIIAIALLPITTIAQDIVKEYYSNGQLKSIGQKNTFKKEVGEWKYYYDDGNLSTIGKYSNGIRIGEWKWFHSNKNKWMIGNYSNGFQVGEWKRYKPNGEISEVEHFCNINANASKVDFIKLRGVSKFTANSKTLTRVDLKFIKASYASAIHPPGSSYAFYILDDRGNKYKIIGQEGWQGDEANGFGRLSKSYSNLWVSLDFENVPLDEVKTLDLIEGNQKESKHWHIYNLLSSNRTIIYDSDECITGDCDNGTGTFKWSTGEKYTGTFKNGRRNGNGTNLFVNGDKYTGAFVNGKMDGKGVYYFKNGNKFEGRCDNNEIGYGKLTTVKGDVIVGRWKDWKLDGNATYNYANGDVYEGEFRKDKRSGYGKYTWKNGNRYIGLWENDFKNGDGIFYPVSGNILMGKYKDDKPINVITYDNPSDKKIIIDKYFNSTTVNKFSSKESKAMKEASLERIVALIKIGTRMGDEKWKVASIDSKSFKIIVSYKYRTNLGKFFGDTESTATDWEKLHYLDFNKLSGIYISSNDDSRQEISIFFEGGLVTRSNDLTEKKMGEKKEGSFGSFDVYFKNNVFDAMELKNELEKFKKL